MPTWVEPTLRFLYEALTVIAHITAIGAYSIAIYLFLFKRKDISSLFQLLINYSHQLSLSELKEKLETLGEYNADVSENHLKVVNILSDIQGQILGNDQLRIQFSEIEVAIEQMISDRKKLSEGRKRKVVSEARERLRHLNVLNIDAMVGKKESNDE